MIQKKKGKKKKKSEDRIPGSGFGLWVGSVTAVQVTTFLPIGEKVVVLWRM